MVFPANCVILFTKIYSTNLPISIGSAIFLVGSVFSIFLIFLLPTSSKVLGVKKDPGAILIMEIFFFKKSWDSDFMTEEKAVL